LSPDGQRWVACRATFFLPVKVLSLLFRRLFLESLRKAFDSGQLRFFSNLKPLQDPFAFARLLARAKSIDWVVYAKAPFGGPRQVLDYVGRYTHRVAISNHRLLDIENGQVSFKWKDYRHGDQIKTMTVSSAEFIRRFLLHVLPAGLQRIRYYGFLGNRNRLEKLELCRRLIGMETPPEIPSDKDYRDRYEDLTGRSLRQCPQCQSGRMEIVAILHGYRF
jgi:Putative transposase